MNNSKAPVNPVRNDEDFGDYFWGVSKGYNIGLTKREYFAGLAMQALVSDIVNAEEKGYEVTADQTAKEAVAQADALLAELENNNDH